MDKKTFLAFQEFITNTFPKCNTSKEREDQLRLELSLAQRQDHEFKTWLQNSGFCEHYVRSLFEEHRGDAEKVKAELRNETDLFTHFELKDHLNESYQKCKNQYAAQHPKIHPGHSPVAA